MLYWKLFYIKTKAIISNFPYSDAKFSRNSRDYVRVIEQNEYKNRFRWLPGVFEIKDRHKYSHRRYCEEISIFYSTTSNLLLQSAFVVDCFITVFTSFIFVIFLTDVAYFEIFFSQIVGREK